MYSVSVFDTKPYDRTYLEKAGQQTQIQWKFFNFSLSQNTAHAAKKSRAVCSFVHDKIDLPCLLQLSELGVEHIALRCAGYNNVDLQNAAAIGIKVTRVPAYSPHAVAEHAVALLLTLNRKIHRAYNRVRELNFSLNGLIGFDIHGKTVGIVGTGKIGRITAQIYRGFGAEVLVYDPVEDPHWANKAGVTYASLQQLLESSHIVSLHVPLLPETYHLISAETLGYMRPDSYLVNTSRGQVIDTVALIKALKENRIKGVALDTYEEEDGIFFEDLSDRLLLDDDLACLLLFPNVLITSHQAFLTHEALQEIAHITVGNLERGRIGEPFLEGTALC